MYLEEVLQTGRCYNDSERCDGRWPQRDSPDRRHSHRHERQTLSGHSGGQQDGL
ncbi:hypothetical protein [Kamptonema formosum]|uniref:hypothetical protein n=1 Tax=Kamptonema formosum TaxID=331992 RepID=UPI00034ACA85|nr:hypothetical protein [Oscillatoria sp. PCC 10802]